MSRSIELTGRRGQIRRAEATPGRQLKTPHPNLYDMAYGAFRSIDITPGPEPICHAIAASVECVNFAHPLKRDTR